jgi:hypothetical protein
VSKPVDARLLLPVLDEDFETCVGSKPLLVGALEVGGAWVVEVADGGGVLVEEADDGGGLVVDEVDGGGGG